jgi:hypothetical protein
MQEAIVMENGCKAVEKSIGEFVVIPMLGLCSGCKKKELQVVADKLANGERVETVVCKHKDECFLSAVYELGEGGVE